MQISVILPCFNEEKTIGKVIDDFRNELPMANIVVIDNNSMDHSVKIAKEKKAEIIFEPRQGKGFVVRRGFDEIEADIYVMVDGDDTYPAKEVKKLIQPVVDGKVDMVIGTRLESANDKTLRPLHQFGNCC